MVLPFCLMLAAIATGPVLFPAWWLRHYPKVAFALAAITLSYYLGVIKVYSTVLHTATEYLSFIILIGSLLSSRAAFTLTSRAKPRRGPTSCFC